MKRLMCLMVIITVCLCGCTGINTSNSDNTDLKSLIDTEEKSEVRMDIETPVENNRTERNEAIEQYVKLYYTIGNKSVDIGELDKIQSVISQEMLAEMQARVNKFNAEGKTNRSIKREQLISLIGDLHTGGIANPENIPISPPDPDEMTFEQAQEYLKEQGRLAKEAQEKYNSTESIVKSDFYEIYLENGKAFVYLDDKTKSPYIEDYSVNSFVNDYGEYELTLEASYYTNGLIIFKCVDTYTNKSIVKVEVDAQGKVTNITDKWLEAKQPSEADLVNFKKSFETLHSESTEKEYEAAKNEISNKFSESLAAQLFGEYNANTGYTTTINRISKGEKDGLMYIEMVVNYENAKANYSIVLEDTDRNGSYDIYTTISIEKEA